VKSKESNYSTIIIYFYYYYYYYAAFNAPCVGHKDDESQAQTVLFIHTSDFTGKNNKVGVFWNSVELLWP